MSEQPAAAAAAASSSSSSSALERDAAAPAGVAADPAAAAIPVRSSSHHAHTESHASLTAALSALGRDGLQPSPTPPLLPLMEDGGEVMEDVAIMQTPQTQQSHEAIDLTSTTPPPEATAAAAAAALAPPPAVAPAAPAAAAAPMLAATPASVPPVVDAASVASSEGPVSLQTASGEVLYEVERIVGKKRNTAAQSGSSTASGGGGRHAPNPRIDPHAYLYKVKWKGFADKDSTWEPYVNVEPCTELMEAFFAEDEAATQAKKVARQAAKANAAALAAATSEAYATAASAVAPPARSSSGRPSLSKLSTFPAGALACAVCQQAGDAAADFVFCKVCFQPAHRPCSEQSGEAQAGVWTCGACAVAESMAAEPAAEPAAAADAPSANGAAAAAASPSSEPASRTDHLRSLLQSVRDHVTRDNWSSVPLTAHGGSAAVDWQTLAAAFQSCFTHASNALAELVPVDVYEHVLSQLLLPAMQAGAALKLVTADGTQPSSALRECMLKAVVACSLTLQLLSIPDVPRRMVQEEYVRAVSDLLLRAIRESILPLWDGTAREKLVAQFVNSQGLAASASAPAKKKAKKAKNAQDSSTPVKKEDEDEATDEEVEEGQQAGGPEPAYWTTLQGHLKYLVHKCASLLGQLTRFQQLEKYPELLASKMQDTCFVVLGLTPVTPSSDVSVLHSLQTACAQWLQKHFLRSDAQARHALLDSLALTYRNLNPARRNLRTYVVQQGTQRTNVAATAAAAVKKEDVKPPADSSSADLSAAINSSVPLPSVTPHLRDQPQVSVQLISALICQLLQSLATQPLLGNDADSSSTSLLERIQREVQARDMAQAAEKVAEAEAAAAAAAGSAKKGKGGKSKQKRRGSKDASEDTEMKTAAEQEEVLPAAVPSSFSALQSALDTPAVRAEFVSTLTAPIASEKDNAAFFLFKLLEYAQPPHKDAPPSSNALTRKTSRQLLRNFIEDLLQMLFAPEFPVAEALLLRMVQLLVMAVDGKDSRFSDGLRVVGMPLLSLIAIHLKLHSAIGTDQPILFRPQRKLEEGGTEASNGSSSAAPSVQGEEVLDCLCGVRTTAKNFQELEESSTDNFLMDCDECHVWYHGACLGFQPNEVPSNWHCNRCVIRMECERQREELQRKRDKVLAAREALSDTSSTPKKGKHKKSASSVSDADRSAAAAVDASLADVTEQLDAAGAARVSASVLRQLLLNYLNAQVLASDDESPLYARQYDLCNWLHQAHEQEAALKKKQTEEAQSSVPVSDVSPAFERDLEACQLNWEPPVKTPNNALPASGAPTKTVLIARDAACSMGRQLSLDRGLGSVLKWPSRILDSLCARCSDPLPGCRAVAVAAIADMVRVDQTVLKDPRVKLSLKRRVEDSSITTREAVVDLIGTFILQSHSDGGSGGGSAVDADYFHFVLGRINDPGISVRKKVVRILRDLCLQPQPHPRYTELAERLILCVRDSEESMQSLSVTIVYEMWFDRTQPRIRDRTQSAHVKIEGAGPQPALLPASASPFSPQFQQLVQLVVGSIARLSASSSTSGIAEGAECLSDILLLLLEQDASLSKAGGAASGEMTSLTGLRMNLLRIKKQQRTGSKAAAVARRPAPASSLSAAFEKEGAAPKGRSKGAAAAAAENTDPNSIRRLCEDMVSVVISMLVHCNSDAAAGAAAAAASSPLPPMLHLVQALRVFSQVFPPFLLPHLQTLLPYLKLGLPTAVDIKTMTPAEQAAYKETAARDLGVVTMLLDIFGEVLPILAAPSTAGAGTSLMSKALSTAAVSLAGDSEFVARLQADLNAILIRSAHPQLIKGAAPTYVLVCDKLLSRPDLLVAMCRTAIAYLWATQLQPLQSNGVRCVITLGLVLRHFDLEAHLSNLNSALPLGAPRTPFWSSIHEQLKTKYREAYTRLGTQSDWMLRADQRVPVPVVDPVYLLFTQIIKALLPTEATPQTAAAAAIKQKTPPLFGFYVLQGITALFSRKPTLIPKSKDAVQRCLTSPHATAELQRHSVRTLREFLQNEDRRMLKVQRAERINKKKKKGGSKGGSAASTPSKRGGKGGRNDDDQDDDEEDDDEDTMADDEHITLDDVAGAEASPASAASSAASAWVQSTIDASDFLPALVSTCEHQLYELVLSPSALVRSEVLQLLGVVLHQAVIHPVDAMPSVVAALTDREPLPAHEASHIVTQVLSRKKEWLRFLEQRFVDGIRLSFDMQMRLWPASFDPLHRRNLAHGSGAPVFDRPPTDGLAQAYSLIKKSAPSRKQLMAKYVNELMSVTRIGIFAQQQVSSELPPEVQAFTSPVKAAAAANIVPHPSLSGRAASVGSNGAPSPMATQESVNGSQPMDDTECPAFVPPVLERNATDPSTFGASPASFASFPGSDASPLTSTFAPAHPLSFLSYLAGALSSFPFEDDEPMHLVTHLSKVINTRGAALQALIQHTIVQIKRRNGETVTDEEIETASQSVQQLAQPAEDGSSVGNGTAAASAGDAPEDQETLLHNLRLQCESAMAISIFIRLRQWLQDSYDLAGRYEEWNLNASGLSSSSSSASRAPLKLKKVLDLPLHFNDLPLDDTQAEAQLATEQRKATGVEASPRKIAGRSQKAAAAAAHARSASTPVHPSPRSAVPVLLQAQFAHFNASMERHAVFLAAKPARRGHKRSATMGAALGGDDASTEGEAPAAKKPRSSKAKPAAAAASKKKKKRKRYGSDVEDESDDDDDFLEEAPRGKAAHVAGAKTATAARGGSGRGKKKVPAIEEEDEEEEESEAESEAEEDEEE